MVLSPFTRVRFIAAWATKDPVSQPAVACAHSPHEPQRVRCCCMEMEMERVLGGRSQSQGATCLFSEGWCGAGEMTLDIKPPSLTRIPRLKEKDDPCKLSCPVHRHGVAPSHSRREEMNQNAVTPAAYLLVCEVRTSRETLPQSASTVPITLWLICLLSGGRELDIAA